MLGIFADKVKLWTMKPVYKNGDVTKTENFRTGKYSFEVYLTSKSTDEVKIKKV